MKINGHNKATEDDIWQYFNGLILSNDLGRIRKLLVRYELFRMALDIPGDIIECGVFKGVGMMYWAKLLEIFSPGSSKKVIGFDTFSQDWAAFQEFEMHEKDKFMKEANFQGMSVEELDLLFKEAGLNNKVEFVEGNVQETAPDYVQEKRGFRISLLNIDFDTYAGTKAALEAFYPMMSRGGVIVFDEYGKRGWGESDAVDEFFSKLPDVEILTVPYSEYPTAYTIKP